MITFTKADDVNVGSSSMLREPCLPARECQPPKEENRVISRIAFITMERLRNGVSFLRQFKCLLTFITRQHEIMDDLPQHCSPEKANDK